MSATELLQHLSKIIDCPCHLFRTYAMWARAERILSDTVNEVREARFSAVRSRIKMPMVALIPPIIWERKMSSPMRDESSDTDAVALTPHFSKNVIISKRRSLVMLTVKFLVSMSQPIKVTLCVGPCHSCVRRPLAVTSLLNHLSVG